jgi:lipoate-protein ligase B
MPEVGRGNKHFYINDSCVVPNNTVRILRMTYNRRTVQPTTLSQEEHDTILLLEHLPVYTLRRKVPTHAQTSALELDAPDRDRLSRTFPRGPGSAPLSVDKDSSAQRSQQPSNITAADVVDALSRSASLVLAPDGTPIYRIDRGGEATYHGPGRSVVYPLLDLKRRPFQSDLPWYLRQIEHVVMENSAGL